jgi:hypothetical protein
MMLILSISIFLLGLSLIVLAELIIPTAIQECDTGLFVRIECVEFLGVMLMLIQFWLWYNSVGR